MDTEYDKCGQAMAAGEVSGFDKQLLECHYHPPILKMDITVVQLQFWTMLRNMAIKSNSGSWQMPRPRWRMPPLCAAPIQKCDAMLQWFVYLIYIQTQPHQPPPSGAALPVLWNARQGLESQLMGSDENKKANL